MTIPRYDPDRHILLRDQAHKRRIHTDDEFAEYLRRVGEPCEHLYEPGSRMEIFDVDVPGWPPAPRSPLQMLFGDTTDPFADKPWLGVQPAVERDWWTDRATGMIALAMVPQERDFDPDRLAYQWQVPAFDPERHVVARAWCEDNGVDLVAFLREGVKAAGLDVFDTTNPDVRAEAATGSYSPTRVCFARADMAAARRAAGLDPAADAGDGPDTGVARGALARFVLLDATRGEDIGALAAGATVPLDPDARYGVRAEIAPGADVGSVVFSLVPPLGLAGHLQTESVAPYSLYGDAGGRAHGRAWPAGIYSLSAIAYSERSGRGKEIGWLSVVFRVKAGASPDPAPAPQPEPRPEPRPAPQPAPQPAPADWGVREISAGEAVSALGAALGREPRLFGGQTADRRILAVRRPALEEWLARDPTSAAIYVHERQGRNFDCDDFAMALKVALARIAGLNGCAIVWGDSHAWCAFFVHGGDGTPVEAVMIEPQTDAHVAACEGAYAVARRCEVYL